MIHIRDRGAQMSAVQSHATHGRPTGDGTTNAHANRDLRSPRRLLILSASGFAAVLIVLTALVALAYREQSNSGAPLNGPAILDGWFHRDSGWYWAIAENGYFYHPGQQSSIAFFPSYPLAVRGTGWIIGGDNQLAGSIVAVLASLAAVLVFARWAQVRLSARSARIAVALVLLYPFSFFLYGPLYGDSLFILAVVVAFALLDDGRPWLAALVGIVATAGRPVGIALTVGLAVRALELLVQQRKKDRGETTPVTLRELIATVPKARIRQFAVLLSITGLVAWCVYLQLEFEDWLAWVHVEEAPGWNQGVGPRTWFKIDFFGTLVKGPLENVLLLVPQALACLAAVLLLPRVRALFGWGYAAFAFGVLAIAVVGTKDFMGTGRYALAAFPVMAAAGDFLARRTARWVMPVALVLSAAGLFTATFFYSRGYAVS